MVGELESVAAAEVLSGDAMAVHRRGLDQVVVHDGPGKLERAPCGERAALPARRGPCHQTVDQGVKGRCLAGEIFR